MAIDPIATAQTIQDRFRRYLRTTFDFPDAFADLRAQFHEALDRPERLFRGPYLHGLAPYTRDASVADLIAEGVLPAALARLPLLGAPERPLYRHQVQAIRRLRQGRNAVVSSGTGSGKTLTFLAPILARILEDPQPGVHALLLYPMNALVNDQLKNLRRILRGVPAVRFGRYINVEVTPTTEREGRRLHPEAPPNEVVSREAFRQDPPHLLVTNYAMLEYLLLRVDDSPLFQGPWRFLVVDEAHTYAGAKGAEVALLLRRLQCRVKGPGAAPPQCIATSATLGTADARRRREVLDFAGRLFGAPFGDDDLILAAKEHTPAEGTCEPDPGVYTDPAVAAACRPGAVWTPELTAALRRDGFPAAVVGDADRAGRQAVAVGLYQAFRRDARALQLRAAADAPCDLKAAANHVFGAADDQAVARLCGLVQVCSLAQVPGGDARLVPCRYHFFVRGLNGAYVALRREDERTVTQLYLEPTRQTEDGQAVTQELRACRKCGQPFLFAVKADAAGTPVLRPQGTSAAEGGTATWWAWADPAPRSDDENDEADDQAPAYPRYAYRPRDGAIRELAAGAAPAADEVGLWLIHRGQELATCFACGGRDTVVPLRAAADAAQTVVGDAFYRALPEAASPPAPRFALDYPGKGRKLLTFADSRQSAAYFAPYFEHSNAEQRLRRLICQALRAAEAREPRVDAETLVKFMVRQAQDEGQFPAQGLGDRCRLAVVTEFCLPFNRRQSLEALALAACGVTLEGRWAPPATLLAYLEPAELEALAQVLLGTIRLLKAIELPPPLSPNHPDFRYQTGPQAVIARGGQRGEGAYRLHGFAPERAPHLQRRAGFLGRVLEAAAARRGLPRPPTAAVPQRLDDLWQGLLNAARPVLRQVTLAKGVVGHQLRWADLWFASPGPWWFCPQCQQWSAFAVLNVCPSFRCTGRLEAADPEARLAGNHYRRIFAAAGEGPVPLAAREHTAQLAPRLATAYQLAFQDGHHADEGQINVLSSSTTFELGVDLGDLEAVFLRNVPPSPANYQQRAGRAGRGVGSAAFAVTFAQPRSHDEHFFTDPRAMIDGQIRPPRIDLANETLFLRHLHAVLLAAFVQRWAQDRATALTTIGALFAPAADGAAPLDHFLGDLEGAIAANARTLDVLLPGGAAAWPAAPLGERVRQAFTAARDYYADEVAMHEGVIAEVDQRRQEAEQARDFTRAQKLYNFQTFLRHRLDELAGADWVTFFSDRCVLPSYAFPIYNVTLATADRDLKLERDLRIALSEYVPGAAIVARGKLWPSVGIRLPYKGKLERKVYARCPNCWHVMRHLDGDQVFPEGLCPVCHHDGLNPRRTKHVYLVPAHGFTTDLTRMGEDLAFDRPQRIPASRVFFVPQQEADDPVRAELGQGTFRVEVRSTAKGDFFVFNDGEDPSGMGFKLCKLCGRQVEVAGKKPAKVKAHKTPFGKDCQGAQYDLVHLGHDFRSCAARLTFGGTEQAFDAKDFWLSLLYALLGGMADALGIEANDVNGVIRPVQVGGRVAQEVVLFDDVPGGAGHALRLEDPDELRAVLHAALARVANCTCGASASCYACLRSYRNQFCHERLARGPVADYLTNLVQALTARPDDDQPYLLPDKARALRAALREGGRVDLVADALTAGGPPETGPWYVALLDLAARSGARVRVALRQPPAGEDALHLLALAQAEVGLFRVAAAAPPPPFGLLAAPATGGAQRAVGFHWGGDRRTTAFDGETHLRPLWFTRSRGRLEDALTATDQWWQAHTEPLSQGQLLPRPEGCTVHPVRAGRPVDFAALVAGLTGLPLAGGVIQDPYLLSAHQIRCLETFLRAVPWPAAAEPLPLTVRSHLADGDPARRDSLPPAQQRQALTASLAAVPAIRPTVDLRLRRIRPLHVRYALFRLTDGGERLFILERGFDMADPKDGNARADTFVLEFRTVPAALRGLLGG